mmetsp:Transcript_16714/g.47756  ORF Transcript_16714/g.47756 Transcript_16714/m.47756 type:complete len:200 (-) Transcript_16714:410-1009(-)
MQAGYPSVVSFDGGRRRCAWTQPSSWSRRPARALVVVRARAARQYQKEPSAPRRTNRARGTPAPPAAAPRRSQRPPGSSGGPPAAASPRGRRAPNRVKRRAAWRPIAFAFHHLRETRSRRPPMPSRTTVSSALVYLHETCGRPFLRRAGRPSAFHEQAARTRPAPRSCRGSGSRRRPRRRPRPPFVSWPPRRPPHRLVS